MTSSQTIYIPWGQLYKCMKMGIIKNNECAYNVLYMLYVQKLWLYTSKLFSKLGESRLFWWTQNVWGRHQIMKVFNHWCNSIDGIITASNERFCYLKKTQRHLNRAFEKDFNLPPKTCCKEKKYTSENNLKVSNEDYRQFSCDKFILIFMHDSIIFWSKKVGLPGTIQKNSVSGSRTLPYLVIFLRNFILIWKCQKGSLNRGALVSATTIYQTNCPFTVLSALFLFFQMLPYDSKLFPGPINRKNITETNGW